MSIFSLHKVNFHDIRAQSLAEQRRREEQELKRQMAMAKRLDKARKDLAGWLKFD